ncbi:Carboxypeptidase regulatory-like domain-containing protein [Bryocella elongata]|uniref:Carboxypeptidase regulatory-like domain-containing protein n=1 Tax=Bryocella elongata TaxID=863522 RepID=A0A1H6BR78_9BACT|nr:carboxypeptidase-like regulatory domain-containing protein [Bryocella elongata]SEG62937.1 Carboxypeptidase regulatory-like domain-containing protein [Bryocella elongata]
MEFTCRAVRRLTTGLAALLLVLTFALAPAPAQVAGTGTIQGTVTDPAGAIIPNAKITLTAEATKVTQVIQTDSQGAYVFPNIPIGSYTVSVAAPGFQTFASKNNVLEVGSNIAVNVKMTIGQETQTVTVQAEGLALQTEDASFKQTVDQQDITELPLNSASRQITGLLLVSGGATAAPAGDFTGSKYSYQTISISVAGGAGNTTLWRLDGGDNNDYMGNGNLPFPFPDALSQFSVESSVLGAQDGMHSGGLVNAVTRSGTNQFHGSAFEFIRNNYLDATNFFSTSKDQLHQNQFGGTFGGPVWIPKVFNGRDRLFFFAGYQHLISKQFSATTQAHVPTAANLLGDFSVTDPAIGTIITPTSCATKTVQLVDPITGVALPGNKYTTTPAWNAQALALQKYLPAINPAIDVNNCGLVSYGIPQNVFDNEFDTRVDWNINSKHNFYGRYFIDGYQAPAFFSPTNVLITTASGNVERTQSLTFGENWTISSRTVNSAHLTGLRRVNNRGYAPNDINAATLGINMYQGEPNGLYLAVTNKFTLGGGTNSVAHFNDNTITFNDDVTLLRGKHQFVVGGELAHNQLNIYNSYEVNGVFTLSGVYSGSGPAGGSITGDGNLDLLRGAMSAFQQSKAQQNALRGNVPSLYAQDTFHATPQLTLVAGIRWSPEFIPVDFFNRGTTFSMSAFLANQVSTVYPNAPAGTLYYGDPGVPRQFTKNSPWQFSPNAALAYDIGGKGKTVIRAGAELIYDEVNFFTGQRTQQNPPFATAVSETQTSTSGPLSLSSPWSVGSLTASPFPQPAVPTPSQALYFAQSQYIVMPTQFHPSYTTQWTASVQHQFGHGWQLQVDYIGNKTTHMPMGIPLSPAVFIPGVWGAGGTGCSPIVTTGAAAVKPGAAGTACSTAANQNSRFALTIANPAQGNQYLGGGGGSVLVGYGGMGNYNGMIASLQHRLSDSFSLLANYTWSKCLNIYDAQGDYAGTGPENPANPGFDYGPCGSDYRDVENISLVATSRFHLTNGIVRAVVNGWEVAALTHITSGAPFNVTTGTDVSLTDIGNDRPNIVAGVPIYTHLANRAGSGAVNRGYLNPAAFCATACATAVTPGTFGNISRNAFRGLPQYQFDPQISRIFKIYENLSTTLRLEAFNALNHPNFSTPTAALNSSTFGQIGSTSNAARVFQGSIKINF